MGALGGHAKQHVRPADVPISAIEVERDQLRAFGLEDVVQKNLPNLGVLRVQHHRVQTGVLSGRLEDVGQLEEALELTRRRVVAIAVEPVDVAAAGGMDSTTAQTRSDPTTAASNSISGAARRSIDRFQWNRELGTIRQLQVDSKLILSRAAVAELLDAALTDGFEDDLALTDLDETHGRGLAPRLETRVELLEPEHEGVAVVLDQDELDHAERVALSQAHESRHGAGSRRRPALLEHAARAVTLPGAGHPGEIVDGRLRTLGNQGHRKEQNEDERDRESDERLLAQHGETSVQGCPCSLDGGPSSVTRTSDGTIKGCTFRVQTSGDVFGMRRPYRNAHRSAHTQPCSHRLQL